MEKLWEQDLAAYTEAYFAPARRYLTDRGVTCGVKLTTVPTGELATWEALTDHLHEYARANAPLPMTVEAPDHSDGSPAAVLRQPHLRRPASSMSAAGYLRWSFAGPSGLHPLVL